MALGYFAGGTLGIKRRDSLMLALLAAINRQRGCFKTDARLRVAQWAMFTLWAMAR